MENGMICLANATEHHDILSVESVGVAQTFQPFARIYKSPGKFYISERQDDINRDFTKILTYHFGSVKQKGCSKSGSYV
jgi:hypothetical protein